MSNKASGGIGFIGLLVIVLVVLKCIGYFPYSWVWVFLPIWGIVAGTIGFIVLFLICVFLAKKLFGE